MQAGRDLDALVAEKVMGWKYEPSPYLDMNGKMVWLPPTDKKLDEEDLGPPRYSTSIEAAWKVVEKLVSQGYELSDCGYSKSMRKWDFSFNLDGSTFAGSLCDTAPHAICIAALRAVGVDV